MWVAGKFFFIGKERAGLCVCGRGKVWMGGERERVGREPSYVYVGEDKSEQVGSMGQVYTGVRADLAYLFTLPFFHLRFSVHFLLNPLLSISFFPCFFHLFLLISYFHSFLIHPQHFFFLSSLPSLFIPSLFLFIRFFQSLPSSPTSSALLFLLSLLRHLFIPFFQSRFLHLQP